MTKRVAGAALAALALALPLALVAPSGTAGAALGRVTGSLQTVQRLPAVPVGAVRAGTEPAARRLSMRVVLAPRDPAALATFLGSISSPSSPSYRHYLARGAFAARFGPTRSAIDAVRAQLRRDGLAVAALSSSHLVLSVTGTARQFAAALHAPVDRWRLPGGSLGYRLGRNARLPASVARYVRGVVGVSSLVREHSFAVPLRGHPRADARSVARARLAPDATRTVVPHLSPQTCTAAQNAIDSSSPGTFTPSEEGQAYGLDAAWIDDDDGHGHTVAVEEFAPYASSDVLAYDKCFALVPQNATSDPLLHNVLVDGGTSPGSGAGSDEPTLDVEEIRALAPEANVEAYLGPNNVTGPIDTLQRIATDDTAQAVSISWGICEAFSDHADETPIFEQMAAQGQTVFAASGDSGSSDCLEQSPPNGPMLVAAAVDDPASQPLVTGVGGLTVDQLSPLDESVWNDCVTFNEPGCLGDAGGGGISSDFARPSWQVAPGAPSGSARGAHSRLVPDLSVMADPSTGMLFYFQGQFQAIGGTSMGAPLMAALDVVAAQSCSTTTLGFLNPLLYAMGRHGGDFVDVTSGNNAVAAQTLHAGEFRAGTGFDMASGLGSPNPSTFLPALCDGPATATAAPTTPSASSLWTVSFHTGSTAYPVGGTITVTAPPTSTLPSSPGAWLVDASTGSHAPSAVVITRGSRSTTGNVATLTLADATGAVDHVSVEAIGVTNPAAVGTGAVVVTDSVDHLAQTAPLALDATAPAATHSTVTVTRHAAAVGGSGVAVEVSVRDASGDAVLGAHVAATASGRGRTLVLRTTTGALGTASFSFRDDRVETSIATVTANGVRVGAVGVAFTDPWRSRRFGTAPLLGRVLGAAAVAATGRGNGWVALVREAGGRLDVVVPHGARLDTAALPAFAVPPAASTPTLARSGGWLYAAYRSTTGHLVVLREGGGTHLTGWHAEDLTALHRVPKVLDEPRLVLEGTGSTAHLSIASISASHLVEWSTASVRAPTRFTTLDVSDAASLGEDATGQVAEVANGTGEAFVVRTTDGRVEMIALESRHWVGDDLAASALLQVGGADAIVGDPVAIASRLGFTVAAVTKNHHVDEFVGTFNNWSAETIIGGAAGSSPPAGHATLPSLAGEPVVESRGNVTVVVVESTAGRLVELSSLGVADPWASYDLTSLARTSGAATGAAALPGRGLELLCTIGGRLVLVHGGTV